MSTLTRMIFAVSNIQFLMVGSLRRDSATFVDNAFEINATFKSTNATFKPTRNNRGSTGGDTITRLVGVSPNKYAPKGPRVKSSHARGGWADLSLWLANRADVKEKYINYFGHTLKKSIPLGCLENSEAPSRVLEKCHICGFCEKGSLNRLDPFYQNVCCCSCDKKGKIAKKPQTCCKRTN